MPFNFGCQILVRTLVRWHKSWFGHTSNSEQDNFLQLTVLCLLTVHSKLPRTPQWHTLHVNIDVNTFFNVTQIYTLRQKQSWTICFHKSLFMRTGHSLLRYFSLIHLHQHSVTDLLFLCSHRDISTCTRMYSHFAGACRQLRLQVDSTTWVMLQFSLYCYTLFLV